MSKTPRKAAPAAAQAATTKDRPINPDRRPSIGDQAARNAAKASIAAGFPCPAQFVEQLGGAQGVAAIEAEVAAEQEAPAAAVATAEPSAGEGATQTTEG